MREYLAGKAGGTGDGTAVTERWARQTQTARWIGQAYTRTPEQEMWLAQLRQSFTNPYRYLMPSQPRNYSFYDYLREQPLPHLCGLGSALPCEACLRTQKRPRPKPGA
jgi:hypothetical protein